MDINFTGFKNIGSMSVTINDFIISGKKNLKIIPSPNNFFDAKILNVHLTDDFNGKDMTEFYQTAQKCKLKDYLNPINKEFMHILLLKNNIEEPAKGFFINNSQLDLNDENLSFFSFLGKLLRKISQTPEKNLVVNKDYLEGDDVSNALIPFSDLKNVIVNALTQKIGDYFPSQNIAKWIGEKAYNDFINEAHSYDIVHSNTKDMCNILQDTMMDYFNSSKYNFIDRKLN